jgi:hypothetical protein
MIDCTCDGTSTRRSISGHYWNCPVERTAVRGFSQQHQLEAVHDGDQHIGTVHKWLKSDHLWIGTYTNLAGLQERYLELTKELAINKLKSVSEAERSQRL